MFGVFEIGKKVRKKPYQTMISRSQSSMLVVPSSFAFIRYFFIKKIFVVLMPCIEPILKPTRAYLAQVRYDLLELDRGFYSGVFGKLPCDDRLHMKVAHLYRYILKQAEDTGLSVQDNSLKFMSLKIDLFYQITIDFFGLSFDEVVGYGVFMLDIFCNDQSESIGASSEKSGIDYCRNITCFSLGNIR